MYLNNIELYYYYTFFSTSFRGIWDQHILSLFIYLITNNSNYLVGTITGISGISQVICTIIIAIYGDKYNKNYILKIGSLICYFNIFITIYSIYIGYYYYILICMILWGFFWAITNPTLDAMVADSIEKGNRSQIYSKVATIRFIGRAFGPFVSIILFISLGDNWSVRICKIVMITGLFLFILPTSLLLLFQPIQNIETLPTTVVSNVESTDTISEKTASSNEIKKEENTLPSNPVELNNNNNNNNKSPIYFTYFPSLLYVPSMIATSDMISGLASGMTIKFFPIFFAQNLELSPIGVSSVIMTTSLVLSGGTHIAQKASKYLGRVYVGVICKILGLLCFTLLLVIYYNTDFQSNKESKFILHLKKLLILFLYVVRTTLMNSSAPLTKSCIMDTVPASQRIKWNSLEAVNNLSWSGSAVIGGIIIDRYGMGLNFITTIIMQSISLYPLLCIAHLVPDETNATNLSTLLTSFFDQFHFQTLFSSQTKDDRNHNYSLVPSLSSNIESETEMTESIHDNIIQIDNRIEVDTTNLSNNNGNNNSNNSK